MDERDNGNAADKVRGRVVYRGYAPKNTYFYFKTIKGILKNRQNYNWSIMKTDDKNEIIGAKMFHSIVSSKAGIWMQQFV